MNFFPRIKLEPGLKVVCIDDGISPERLIQVSEQFQNWIKNDVDYTVRKVYEQVNEKTGKRVVSFLLEEVKNEPIFIKELNQFIEPAFAIERFAVWIEEPKLDLGIRSN